MDFTELPQWVVDLGYTLIDWIENWVKIIEIGSEG